VESENQAGHPGETGNQSKDMNQLLALSIRQPWAWLLANGHKDIENRTWHTNFRGPFLIHASALKNSGEWEATYWHVYDFISPEIADLIPSIDALDYGGIVGEAVLTGCVDYSLSKWWSGLVGFEIQQARPLPFRPCRGSLKFFRPDFR